MQDLRSRERASILERGRLRQLALLLCAWLWVACGDGPLIVLGDREPPRFRFDPPQPIEELAAPAKTDNPSLTADMLEIFFTSEREGPLDLYVARRPERSAQFGPAERIAALNTPGVATAPAIAPDGLTLWFASDRAGGLGDLDIWVTTRSARDQAWLAPTHLPVLSSSRKDIPRPLGQRARVMPMASDRETAGYYRLYLATRRNASSPFSEPVQLEELAFPGESTVDGFLTDDGLTLLYVSGPGPFGAADIYVASRRSISDPFEQPTPLSDVNTPSDERDPWLSPDGRELYFASDRSGVYAIYVAARRDPSDAGP